MISGIKIDLFGTLGVKSYFYICIKLLKVHNHNFFSKLRKLQVISILCNKKCIKYSIFIVKVKQLTLYAPRE